MTKAYPLKDPSSRAYILILGSPSSITPLSLNRSRGSLTSASSGGFVTYATVFLDFGGLRASVDLELLLLFEPLPRLVEVAAEDGSYLPSLYFLGERGWAWRESTNVNIRVRFRM